MKSKSRSKREKYIIYSYTTCMSIQIGVYNIIESHFFHI